MNTPFVLFVLRKSHQGNFSIENIYNGLYSFLKGENGERFRYGRLQLSRTFDFLTFINCFITSFFSQKKIVHITGGCDYMVMAFPGMIRVWTVHDTFRYREMRGIRGRLFDWLFYRLPVRFSHSIICVSNATKESLEKYFPEASTKIVVVHNPLPIANIPPVREARISKRERTLKILQIGAKPLKNYERLIMATIHLNVQYTFVQPDNPRIRKLIQQHKLQERARVANNLSRDAFLSLYETHDVLFFASEREGFGLPIIEAQAYGLPVITSNIAPMNSIGKNCILVDPFDTESIALGFEKLYDPAIVRMSIKKGYENYEEFKMEHVSRNYQSLYEDLAQRFL